MAIYHFSTQAISRGQGRSIVACAAYRAGELLYDERYQKTHDYTGKEGVAHGEILLPADAPAFMQDRETLWNHVEAIEKRKDARLAREVQFSLPKELTLEQNIALTREFVQKTFVDHGMVADFSIHVDKGKDGAEQPHAHVLLTTREVGASGFGLKNPDWNRKEMLLAWREQWADIANRHLALHGHDLRIDHRSYAAQGIELEPQHKIGTVAARDRMARLADHQRIARENGERIFRDPSIALDALTRQQSTFTWPDLARFVNRHSEDAEQFKRVFGKVQASPELVYLGKDGNGKDRLTTREMLDIESAMLRNASILHEQRQHEVKGSSLNRAIGSRSLSDEQQNALRYVVAGEGLKSVVGFAGTGKSYMLGAAREAWEESGYRVRGVTLSGIAAQNLFQSSGIESGTVASLFHRWDNNRDAAEKRDIFVIDEAGMLGSRQMERLISEAQDKGAKVVLVGDWQQLQAIEAGAAFRAIAEEHQYVELNQIRRQQVDWQRDASLELAKGRVETALTMYHAKDHIHEFATQAEAKQHLIGQWNDTRHTRPQETSIILAYTRKEVHELNTMARELKRKDGELGQDHEFSTERGKRSFAEGDRIYFLKRDNGINVVNGTLGTVRSVDGYNKKLLVEIDRDDLKPEQRMVTVDTKEYGHIEHGYAATVYKAQGVTVDRSYILASKYYDAHSAYVGMSRHRQSCDIYTSKEEFADRQELVKIMGRDRTKDVTLDYTRPEKEFARQRSIRPEPDHDYTHKERIKRLLPKGREYEKRFSPILEKQGMEKERFLEKSRALSERFRQERPDAAQRITRKLVPEHQSDANRYMRKLAEYERDMSRNRLTVQDRKEFDKYTKEVTQSSAVMNHIRQQMPDIEKRIKAVSQEYQKQRQLEYSWRGLDRDR